MLIGANGDRQQLPEICVPVVYDHEEENGS